MFLNSFEINIGNLNNLEKYEPIELELNIEPKFKGYIIKREFNKFIANLQPLVTILPNSVCSFLSTRYLFIPKNRELYKKTLKLVNICGADYINSQVVREAARFSTSYTVADFNFDKETLLISGDKDRLVSIKYTKKLASEKNYEIKVIKDAGHLINYERPDKVAKIIADFLAQ